MTALVLIFGIAMSTNIPWSQYDDAGVRHELSLHDQALTQLKFMDMKNKQAALREQDIKEYTDILIQIEEAKKGAQMTISKERLDALREAARKARSDAAAKIIELEVGRIKEFKMSYGAAVTASAGRVK